MSEQQTVSLSAVARVIFVILKYTAFNAHVYDIDTQSAIP